MIRIDVSLQLVEPELHPRELRPDEVRHRGSVVFVLMSSPPNPCGGQSCPWVVWPVRHRTCPPRLTPERRVSSRAEIGWLHMAAARSWRYATLSCKSKRLVQSRSSPRRTELGAQRRA